MAHPVRLGLGVICLIMGVIGAVLPVLQGWIFFALAGAFFFPQHRWVHGALARAEQRIPRVVAFLRRRGVGSEAAIL
jgi:uncharacterized membrane protein YbaN (DUF454 family)